MTPNKWLGRGLFTVDTQIMTLETPRPRRCLRRKGVVGDESGAVLVFTVVIMAVLLMFAALAIDLPMQMNERRTAQNAADHAALSATWAP